MANRGKEMDMRWGGGGLGSFLMSLPRDKAGGHRLPHIYLENSTFNSPVGRLKTGTQES